METILKIECKGEFRRALLPNIPSYALVDRAIHETWPGRSAKEAKYRDEEHDLCTLSEKTFFDFLATSRAMNSGRLLRLELPEVACDSVSSDGRRSIDADASLSLWSHVEFGNGIDSDSESLHELVDLTDVEAVLKPELGEDQSEDAQCCHPMLESEKEASREGLEEFIQKTISLNSTTIVYSIHTPPPSPASSPRERSDSHQSSFEESSGINVGGESRVQSDCNKAYESGHSVDEMIDIIMFAFDKMGDGHLNFEECNALQKAAWGGEIPLDMYQKLCLDMNEEPETGLGRDALLCIYCDSAACSEIIDRDFQVAKRKLEGNRREYGQQRMSFFPKRIGCNVDLPCAWDAVSFFPKRIASSFSAHTKRQNGFCYSRRFQPLR
jgi:hypothetical protein